MKKTIVVLFLVFLYSNLSNAQIYKGFGVKVGTSIASQILSQGAWGGTVYKYGFTGGIFRETHLIEKLSLVTGINYSQKGAIEEFSTTNSSGYYSGERDFKREANFVTVEVLAKYGGSVDKLSPYILAGARMDVFTSGKNTYDENYFFLQYYPYPVSNNKTFGGTIGLGLDYKPSKLLTLFIESTYNPDLTYFGENETPYGYSYKSKNYSFDIRTGIKF
jgi:hypothetical protein